MGEANLRFVRKEKQDAINLCMAVIRQVRFLNWAFLVLKNEHAIFSFKAPDFPEPFQALSFYYEDIDPEKSFQFSLIAAHLSPQDADAWLHLTEVNFKLIFFCFLNY